MKTHHLILSLSISLIAVLLQASVSKAHSDTSTVGIIYGPKGDNLPHLPEVAKILQTTGINDVMVVGNVSPYSLRKLVHARPLLKLIVKPGAENQRKLIEMMSITERTNKKHGVDAALGWLQSNVLALSHNNTVIGDRGVQISCIVIGTDGIFKSQKNLPYLIPTLRNLYGALKKLNLSDKIKLSSPILSSIFIRGHDADADDGTYRGLDSLEGHHKFYRGCAKVNCDGPPSGDQNQRKADNEIDHAPDHGNDHDHKNNHLNHHHLNDNHHHNDNIIRSTLSELLKFLSETRSPMFLKVDGLDPILNKRNTHTLKVIDMMLSQLVIMQPAIDSRISSVVIETGWPTTGHRRGSPEVHEALAYNTELIKAVNKRHFWPGVKFQLFFGSLFDEKGTKGTSEILD